MIMQVNGLSVEVFAVDAAMGVNKELFPEPGYYWWCCLPGALPDSDPYGPFADELTAVQNAIDNIKMERVA